MRNCVCIRVHMCVWNEFSPIACEVEHFPLDVPAVDTHRPKPTVRVLLYCNCIIDIGFQVTHLARSQEQALENLPKHY